MSEDGSAETGAQATAQEPERPTGTLDLLRHVRDAGPATLSPLEARRLLSYVQDSERARATLRIRLTDAERRAKSCSEQLVAYRQAAAERETELEAHAVRLAWRLREGRGGLAWGLLEDVERLYRIGASPDEWAQCMARVGAALLGGVR